MPLKVANWICAGGVPEGEGMVKKICTAPDDEVQKTKEKYVNGLPAAGIGLEKERWHAEHEWAV